MVENLIEYWKDRYTPAELIEHIEIDMDTLVQELWPYIAENIEDFSEDLEELGLIEEDELGTD